MSSTTDLTTEVIKPIKIPKVKRIRTPKDSLFSTMKMNLTEKEIQRTIAKTEKMKSKELKVEAQPKIRKAFVQKPVNLGKLGKYNLYLGVSNDTWKVNIGWNIAKYSFAVFLLAISVVGIYFWTAWQATQTVINGVNFGSGILVRLGIINPDQSTGSYLWSIFTDPNIYNVTSPILDLKILTDLNQLISINTGVLGASISEISKTFSETMMISLLVYAIIRLLYVYQH